VTSQFKWLYRVTGSSSLGDWWESQIIRWHLVETLRLTTWEAGVIYMVVNLFRLLGSLPTYNSLERKPARKVLCICSLLLAAAATTMSSLAWHHRLTEVPLTITASFAGFIVGLMVRSGSRINKEIGGELQSELKFKMDQASYIGRILAGLSGGILRGFGTWLPLALNAITFLPLALYMFLVRPEKELYALQPVDGEPTKQKATTAWQGLRFVLSQPDMRLLFAIDVTRLIFFQGIPFGITPEIIKHDYSGTDAVYGLWMAVTGLAGWTGSIIGSKLGLKTRGVILGLMLSACCNIACSFAPNIWVYFAMYLLYVATWTTPSAQLSSEWQQLDVKWSTAVSQVNTVFLYGVGPVSLVALTWLGSHFHLGPRKILLVTSLIGMVCYLILAYLVKTRGFQHKLITGKKREDAPA
jgi:hypothetical protein